MESITDRHGNTLFTSEQECISYLFHKRWPEGFHCPFCDIVQPDMAPAHTVVCRYCRKQSSITANTLMHGSKKSILEWVRVALLFCCTEDGTSARSLQNTFHISSYQTAWNWLRRLRKAAAIAESQPLRGKVSVSSLFLQKIDAKDDAEPNLVCCREIVESVDRPQRLRLSVVDPRNPHTAEDFIRTAVMAEAIIVISDSFRRNLSLLQGDYHFLAESPATAAESSRLNGDLQEWMDRLYRGATASRYTQDYLDEFTFRYNTSGWTDKRKVLDHLFTGLLYCASPPVHQLKLQGGLS